MGLGRGFVSVTEKIKIVATKEKIQQTIIIIREVFFEYTLRYNTGLLTYKYLLIANSVNVCNELAERLTNIIWCILEPQFPEIHVVTMNETKLSGMINNAIDKSVRASEMMKQFVTVRSLSFL